MTFLLPASQGSGIPVGAIMAWNLETPPQYDGGTWLECNGQQVDGSKYRKLASMMQTVPDYRGVFLRGLGDYSVNGVTHSSSSLYNVQGDSSRELDGAAIGLSAASLSDAGMAHPAGSHLTGEQPFWYSVVPDSRSYSWLYSAWSASPYTTASLAPDWYNALTKYRYYMSASTDDKGNTSYSLVETQEHPSLNFNSQSRALNFDVSRVWPVSNEFRPINKAVKYFIKAK